MSLSQFFLMHILITKCPRISRMNFDMLAAVRRQTAVWLLLCHTPRVTWNLWTQKVESVKRYVTSVVAAAAHLFMMVCLSVCSLRRATASRSDCRTWCMLAALPYQVRHIAWKLGTSVPSKKKKCGPFTTTTAFFVRQLCGWCPVVK
jgi:hypothetical protein